jgi:hypothetical protein
MIIHAVRFIDDVLAFFALATGVTCFFVQVEAFDGHGYETSDSCLACTAATVKVHGLWPGSGFASVL